jgi:hypothetical protein
MMMRGPSLQALHNRVNRLAAECQADEQDTTIVYHWINRYDVCPRYGCDLREHARVAAAAKAQAEDRRTVVFWVGDLPACPSCGAVLANPA